MIIVPDGAQALLAAIRLLRDVLAERTGSSPWWLGYLDTGTDDVVFNDAPRITLCAGWKYVLVHADRDQAEQWQSELARGEDLDRTSSFRPTVRGRFPGSRMTIGGAFGGPSDLINLLVAGGQV